MAILRIESAYKIWYNIDVLTKGTQQTELHITVTSLLGAVCWRFESFPADHRWVAQLAEQRYRTVIDFIRLYLG